MKIVVVGNLAVNLSQVAYAEKNNIGVLLHFTAPIPSVVSGVTVERGTAPPAASNHVQLQVPGEDGEAIWRALKNG